MSTVDLTPPPTDGPTDRDVAGPPMAGARTGSTAEWSTAASTRSTIPTPPPPPRRRDRRDDAANSPRRGRGLAAVALVAALSGAAVATPIALFLDDDVAQPSAAPPVTAAAADPDRDADAVTAPAVVAPGAGIDTAAVAAAVTPSVVRIDVSFGAQGAGSGSGVVVDDQGHVVTNNHVVDGVSTVTVTLSDGRSLDAEVLGTDPTTDLAVLSVDADDLVPVTIADEAPTLGDPVVAIGSPFGLDGSVTSGIVSALGRTVNGSDLPLTNLVQTDAAINPGNSGGALVDANGELVGINTAIASSGGGSDGIGFAIDTSTLTSVVDDLLTDGEVSRSWLGVRGATAADPTGDTTGAFIDSVVEDSPAAQAGLQPGDLVVAIDSESVEGFPELATRLARLEPGTEVTLTIQREGSEQDLDVTLGEA